METSSNYFVLSKYFFKKALAVLFLLLMISNYSYTQITVWTDNFNSSLEEHFNGSLSGWTTSGTAGNYWTYNSSQYFCATGSAKCTPNSNYSNNVDVYLTKSGLNFSSYNTVEYRFNFYGVTEFDYDFVYFQYSTNNGGSWTSAATISGNYSDGWYYTLGTLPNTTTDIRFYFHSDNSFNYSGLYIDDLNVTGLNWTPTAQTDKFDYWMPSDDCGTYSRFTSSTQSLRCTAQGAKYSKNMTNSLTRNINLASYSSGSIDFKIWTQTQPNNDVIYFEYYSGGVWTPAWTQSGDYSGTGWQTITGVPIPSSATQIRFRFTSNQSQQFEGVYIDDVVLNAYPICTAPTLQAANMTFTSIGCNSITVNWDRGTGDNVIVLARMASAVNADPGDGNGSYVADAAFGSGSQIGNGNYVVYKGNGTSVNVTNLAVGTNYYFNVYEYSNSGPCYKSSPLTGNSYTLLAPTILAHPLGQTVLPGGSTDFSVSASGGGTLTYQWQVSTNGGASYSNITVAGSNPTYSGWTTATLNVNSVVAGNNGYRYRCVVSGTCSPSVTSNNAILTIGTCTTPALPTSLIAAAAGPNSVSISWAEGTPSGSSPVTYYWAVGPTGVTYESGYTVRGTTTNLNETVNGLACGTTYYFNVKAVTGCDASTNGYPAQTSFTTTACTNAAYRSNANPTTWGTAANWQSSTNCGSGAWGAAGSAPTNANACLATVRAGYPVNVAANTATPPSVIIDNSAVLTINSGRTLTIPAGYTLTNYGTLTITGTLTLNGTLINYGTINNNGVFTGNGTIINYGTINNNATRTFTISASRTTINYGTVNNSGTVIINGTLSNYGSYNEGYWTYTNAAAARVYNYTGGTFTIISAGEFDVITSSSSCTNYGTFINNGTTYGVTVRNSGIFNNYGTYYENAKTIIGYTANGAIFNNYNEASIIIGSSGRIQMGNSYTGTLNNYGIVENNATTSSTSYGIIVGWGTLNNYSGGIINNGSPTNNNPYLYINASYNLTNAGTINNYGGISGASIYGRVYVGGTFINNSGGEFNNFGDADNDIRGLVYGSGTFTNNSGGIINNGLRGFVEVKTINNSGTYNEGGNNYVDGGYMLGLNWTGSTFNNNATGIYNILPMGASGYNSIYIGWTTTQSGTFNNSGVVNINKDRDGTRGMTVDQGGLLNNSGTLNNYTAQINVSPYGVGGTITNSGTYNEYYNTIIFTNGTLTNTGTFNVKSTGSLTTDANITCTSPGNIINEGTVYLRGNSGAGVYVSGTGTLTTYPGSWLKMESVSGSADFINSGTGSGNVRVSIKSFDSNTNYYLSSTYANISLGSGFPATVKNLELTAPNGIVFPSDISTNEALIIYSGNVSATNKTINVGTDFFDGGSLDLGASGTLKFTGSGRYKSNPNQMHETFEFPTTNWASSSVIGWLTQPNGWVVSEGSPRSLKRSLLLKPSVTRWVISPQVDLLSNRRYTVTVWYKDSIAGSNASFVVKYASDTTVAAMNAGTVLFSTVAVSNTSYTNVCTSTFYPTTSGRYYIGIQGTTPAGQRLYIDDIMITENSTNEILKNFEVSSGGSVLLGTPAYIDATNGTLKLTNGAFTTNGALGNNFTVKNNATIECSGGILADMPIFENTTDAINVIYTTPSPIANIITRSELPTSESNGLLNNLTVNNSAGVTLSKASSSSALLYSQNFDGGSIPSGWSSSVTNDIGTIGSPQVDFPAICTFFSGSVTPNAVASGTNMVRFNSGNCDNTDQIKLCMTSPVNVSGYRNIRVNFDWFRQTDFWVQPSDIWSARGLEGVTLLWSANGSSWHTNVYFASYENAGTTGWQTKTVLLPKEAENISTLYIGLLFTAQGSQDCVLDNLSVTGIQYNGQPVNVTVNGAGGSGILTLTQGALSLNTDTLTINNSLTNAIQRTNGYILTNDADLNFSNIVNWKMGSTPGAHIYPFGKDAANYIPFTFNLTAGTIGNVMVSTYPSDPASSNNPSTIFNNKPTTPLVVNIDGEGGTGNPGNASNIVRRFWLIEPSGSGTANVTFTYPESEIPLNGEEVNDMKAQRYNVSLNKWEEPLASQVSNTTTNTVTVTGITNFSPWAISRKSNLLPVELLSFTANCNNGKVQVEWQTASELNNDYFTVERSNSMNSWETVGIVPGSGTVNYVNTYTLTDNIPYVGYGYYRLKQTDFDGSTKCFNPVLVSCSDNSTYSFDVAAVYTDHNTGNITINFTSPRDGEEYSFAVYNDKGSIQYQQKGKTVSGFNQIEIPSSNLAYGIYLITLSNSERMISQKVLLE